MIKKIHDFFQALLVITLLIYIGIWVTVSYVGVYVTYVAAPIIFISGVMMYLCGEKENDGKNTKL